MTDVMETTGLCNMGLSPTLMAIQDKDDSQDLLSIESEIVNDCLGPCNGKDKEGMTVVEAVEVAEVAKTIILVVSGNEDVLINAPLQASDSSQTSSSGD